MYMIHVQLNPSDDSSTHSSQSRIARVIINTLAPIDTHTFHTSKMVAQLKAMLTERNVYWQCTIQSVNTTTTAKVAKLSEEGREGGRDRRLNLLQTLVCNLLLFVCVCITALASTSHVHLCLLCQKWGGITDGFFDDDFFRLDGECGLASSLVMQPPKQSRATLRLDFC